MNKRILLIDNQIVVQIGFCSIVKSAIKNISIECAESYSVTLEKIESQSFDLIVIEVNTPEYDQEIIKMITKVQKEAKILLFTSLDEAAVLSYIKAGANGYLSKTSKKTELVKAVKSILESGIYFSKKTFDFLLSNSINENDENPFERLSSRELEVLDHILGGRKYVEISKELNMKLSTITTYKKRILTKTEVSNVMELQALFFKHHK